MKLYDQSRAPNPRRVRIFLAEKGVAIPLEQVDLMQGEHRSASFSALNPMQQVPALVLDDGSVISESIAICRYLEALHPAPSLFGSDARQIAFIEMWNRRVELGLMSQIAQCIRHTHPAFAVLEKTPVKEWGEINREKVVGQLEFLDRELSSRPFVAGDAYSVADITALVAVDFMKLARIERPASLAALADWHGRVSSRPSARA